MKILAIRGRNLASLEGEFFIDFTVQPLLSAGIFAISGPTGAGKSTILDAMCLALFARTPRTEQAKENNVKVRDVNEEVLPQSDPRFLLRRGTASGYAEVDFGALDGHRYRSRWSVGRARDKESGRLQAVRISLYNLDREAEEQGTRSDLQARIIELIGLTFEQFTRSVLLAQNDFSTFLKAEQGEKASLLEKLTGTELYSALSRLIFEKNGKAKEAYEQLQARIQGIEVLTEEELCSLQSALADAEAQSVRLEKLKQEKLALQEAVRTINQQIVAKQVQQKEATNRLAQATDLVTAAQKEYEQALQEQKKAELFYKSLQPDLLQARNLDIRLETVAKELSLSQMQLKEAQKRKQEGEDKWKEALVRQQKGEKEIGRLMEWQQRFRSKESIAEQLTALLLHLDAASAARLQVDKANRQLASFRIQAEQIKQKRIGLQQTIEAKRITLQQIVASYQQLEEEQKKPEVTMLDKEIEKVRAQREHLLVEQARLAATGNIRELREKLQEGQPCPVCGSIHHPAVGASVSQKIDQTARIITQMTLRLEELTDKKQASIKEEKRLRQLQQQQMTLHKELMDTEAVCQDLVAQLNRITDRLGHETVVLSEQSEILSRSLSAANILFGNDEWQKAWLQDPDRFRETLTDFARQWHDNKEKLQSLERQQGALKAACDSLASFLPSLMKAEEETARLHEQKRTILVGLQMDRSKLLEGRPADLVEQESNRHIEGLREQLARLLTIQTEQRGIAEQSRGIADQISKDLMEAMKELERRQHVLQAWQAGYQATFGEKVLEETLLQATQQKSEYTYRLRVHQENRLKIVSLQDNLNKCRLDSERWAKLNELAGSADGAKFRRIAQGYTLDLLLEYANVQLRNLTRRYRLERVPETLALQVIDRDMCDEVRTVHSLSGGESFLVSLALALGLSALSSNRMRVESLFIDEGFGSLDAETLRVAMDALESLRTQGRKIGVISHVQEMTERIPVQVRVNRAGNGRSFLDVV